MKNIIPIFLLSIWLALVTVIITAFANDSSPTTPVPDASSSNKNLITKPSPNYVKFEITGLKPVEKKNVLLMLNEKLAQTAAFEEKERVSIFFARSPEFITEALRPYGYFEPMIQKQISHPPTGWVMFFHIDPGPQVKINSVQVQILGDGKNDDRFHRLITNFPVKAGQNLNALNYQKAKNAFSNLAAGRGYFKAKFIKSQMIVNLYTHQADIIFIFDTDKRYYFGPTYFSGSTLRRSFLRRYLLYERGGYYNSILIQRLQQDLASSYYFKQVTVTTIPNDLTGEVPVKVHLIPNNPRQYIFGLGYGTDTGVRATLGLQIRQVNREGHYFNSLLRAPQNNSTLSVNYVIPGKRPAYDFYTLNAAVGSIDQVSGHSESFKIGPSYTSQLTRKWSINLGSYFLKEHYHLSNEPSTNAELIVNYVRLERKHQEVLINPQQGYNISFNIAGGPSTANISRSFIQEKIQSKGLYTFTPSHTRLIGRGELGRTDIDDINHLPLSLQLFAGGANSIRGYSYNSIGPGRNLIILSGELQQRIYKSFYLAGFYDAGNVGNKDYLSHIKQGVGPGLVVLSPIGAFELTIARRLGDGTNHPSYQIQFSMGPDL